MKSDFFILRLAKIFAVCIIALSILCPLYSCGAEGNYGSPNPNIPKLDEGKGCENYSYIKNLFLENQTDFDNVLHFFAQMQSSKYCKYNFRYQLGELWIKSKGEYVKIENEKIEEFFQLLINKKFFYHTSQIDMYFFAYDDGIVLNRPIIFMEVLLCSIDKKNIKIIFENRERDQLKLAEGWYYAIEDYTQ